MVPRGIHRVKPLLKSYRPLLKAAEGKRDAWASSPLLSERGNGPSAIHPEGCTTCASDGGVGLLGPAVLSWAVDRCAGSEDFWLRLGLEKRAALQAPGTGVLDSDWHQLPTQPFR